MKTTRVIILCLSFIISFSCSDSGKSGPSIKGRLTNASGITVYLQSISENGESILDSAQTDADGNFVMNNPVKELDYYVFRTDPGNVAFLILQGGEQVEITGDAMKLDPTYRVKGSKDSELIRQLRQFELNLGDSLNRAYSELRSAGSANLDSMGSLMQAHYNSTMQDFCVKFVNENLNSIASLSATKYLDKNASLDLMEKLGQNLHASIPGNKYVADYMGLLQELKKLPLGSEAPEIKLPSPDGALLSLSSLKGKIVLVDFWASWCGPCRKENPFIVSLYNKYNKLGFDIFGVSLDEDANAWKEAIKKDRLTWLQVSDLKRWNSDVARLYGVDAIPFSVLLDREGKIIGKGLRGEELENKIRDALGINS